MLRHGASASVIHAAPIYAPWRCNGGIRDRGLLNGGGEEWKLLLLRVTLLLREHGHRLTAPCPRSRTNASLLFDGRRGQGIGGASAAAAAIAIGIAMSSLLITVMEGIQAGRGEKVFRELPLLGRNPPVLEPQVVVLLANAVDAGQRLADLFRRPEKRGKRSCVLDEEAHEKNFQPMVQNAGGPFPHHPPHACATWRPPHLMGHLASRLRNVRAASQSNKCFVLQRVELQLLDISFPSCQPLRLRACGVGPPGNGPLKVEQCADFGRSFCRLGLDGSKNGGEKFRLRGEPVIAHRATARGRRPRTPETRRNEVPAPPVCHVMAFH